MRAEATLIDRRENVASPASTAANGAQQGKSLGDAGSARTVAAGAATAAAGLAADDVTIVGVADDPLIVPALIVAGVATVVAEVADNMSEVHANSHESKRPTEVYHLVNRKTGAIDKIGVTSFPAQRYSQAWLRANDVRYQTVAQYQSRYVAKVHENIALVHYGITHGHLPRLNLVPW
jgi:hypothetical protein